MLDVLIELSPVSPVLAAISPSGIWNAVWPYILMLLGFSFIVFVHELGHFAVAKWADVRVERFAIGFGKELFGFTKGETRYSFNILPLGGYVKMLGQEDFDDKSNEFKFKEDPRSFANKSVGRRMAVVSAGVIMNLIAAALLFMVVFMIGMDAIDTRIGYVQPDSPADVAGLQPGDRVKEINGAEMLEFNDVLMSILLSAPHEDVEFIVERNGETLPPIYVRPESRPDEGRQIVGIAPSYTREVAYVAPVGSRFAKDAPKPGDVLVEVGGQPITDQNIDRVIYGLAYMKGPLVVERKDPNDPDAPPKQVEVRIAPTFALYPSDPADTSSTNVLGLTPLVQFDAVDPKGRAFLAGIDTGDVVLRWGEYEYPTRAQMTESIRANPNRDLYVVIQKTDGSEEQLFVRPKPNEKYPATIRTAVEAIDGAAEGQPRARLTHVRAQGSAARAGIADGDVVLRVGEYDMPSAGTVRDVIGKSLGRPISIVVRKPDGRELHTSVVPEEPGDIQAKFDWIPNEVLRVGGIDEEIGGRPSPAAVAGIPAGALIREVDGQPVSTWQELIEALRVRAGSDVRLTYRDRAGSEQHATFPVPRSIRTVLGVGPEAQIVSIGGKERVDVSLPTRVMPMPVTHPTGTAAALEELVGEKQIRVEYRPSPLAEVQSAYIDVTPDMVDPWLGRAVFSSNMRTLESTHLLKGENVLDAIWIGIHKTHYFVLSVYTMIERMVVSRTVGVENISGPLGIVDLGGQIARTDPVRFLFFLAMLSANLAVINFLPLPIVDGGLMVFLIIEKIKGSPVSLKVQVATQMIGLFLIIFAFIFVTFNDALRMWG